MAGRLSFMVLLFWHEQPGRGLMRLAAGPGNAREEARTHT